MLDGWKVERLRSRRPLLGCVQDSGDIDGILTDLIHHNVGQRWNYEFARSLFLAGTAPVRKGFEDGSGLVKGADEPRSVLRCFVKQVIGDSLEVSDGTCGPAKPHQ